MSGIKNFTVIAQAIKNKGDGLIAYVNYLTNEKVPSHKNTEIYPVFPKYARDSEKFLTYVLTEVAAADKASSGRAYSNYAQSFDFVLPNSIKPTPEQWQLITKDLIKTMHKELFMQEEISPEKKNLNYKGTVPSILDFAGRTFCNIHDQKNPHLNMVIPTIYGGERLQRIDRKRLTNEIKKQFNLSVLNHCKMDFKAYKPEKVKLGRRKPRNQYLAEKAAATVADATKEMILQAQHAKNDVEEHVFEHMVHVETTTMQQQRDLSRFIDEQVQSLAQHRKAAKPAEIDAEQKSFWLKKLVTDINKLADSVVTWVTSIVLRSDDLDIESNRQNVLSARDEIEQNELYSESMGKDVENIIDTYEKDVENSDLFTPVSKKRSKFKY